jgi:hypothetical protein
VSGRGALGAILGTIALLEAYPLDGLSRTRIRRLTGYRLSHEGKIKRTVQLPPGAFRTEAEVVLRLKDVNSGFDLTSDTRKVAGLQKGLESIFASRDPSYNIAILDISDPRNPRYAAVRADQRYIPGSVAKLFVATGLFGSLQKAYPHDTGARERVLRETMVTADSFVHRDGKTVPFYNEGDAAILNRRLEVGDRFNLYEWLDHMLSQSSNAAGSMCWKQALLIQRFGTRYPLPSEEEKAFFKDTPKKEQFALALESIESAFRASNLDTAKLRLGTFFTSNASSAIPGGGSYATPNELLRWLVRMEQGKLVDAWSSLEIKKLMYFTRPRYRYASSPALNNAVVFFKSGSLFECTPEPGFKCLQYRGNKTNLMHSVAVVESGSKVYLVALMSNVLRLNSAVEHQTIATLIERLIQSQQ